MSSMDRVICFHLLTGWVLLRLISLDFFHHRDKLFERDLSVSILVDLFDDCINGGGIELVGATELQDFLDLVSSDDARAVFVEHLECCLQFVVRRQLVLVHGGDHELWVVDKAAAVRIHSREHTLNLLVGHNLAVVLEVAFLDLVDGELAVAVLVKRLENASEVIFLLLR